MIGYRCLLFVAEDVVGCRFGSVEMSCERIWLVVVVVIGYLGAGGLLFQALGPPPYPAPPYAATISRHTEACLNQLWAITGNS